MNAQRLQIRKKRRGKQLGKERAKEQHLQVLSFSHNIILNIRLRSILHGLFLNLCTFLPFAEKTPERPSLDEACNVDAVAAAADDAAAAEIEENDPSVKDVGQQRPSGSEASTPSTESPHGTASHLPRASSEGQAATATDTDEEGEDGEGVHDAETGKEKGKAAKTGKRKERCDTESDEPAPASKRG
jgi:hypothetical protein